MINNDFQIVVKPKINSKINTNNKKYTIFTRGCFDCLHLGHFVLLTTMLVESSKILSCNPFEINFLLSLSDQKTENFKNTKFINTEEERKNNLLKTGLINEIVIHNDNQKVLFDNLSRINCFCIGEDQTTRKTFQNMFKTCEENNILVLKLSSRVTGISSTLIRREMLEKSLNYIEAKSNIESKAILDETSRKNIILLKNLGIITDENLKFFNLDSEAKTLTMKQLNKIHTKNFFVEKYKSDKEIINQINL